jgi:hypothetical protein
MRHEIWSAYSKLTPEERNYFQQQFGDEFRTKFLNRETRDYYSIPGQTMAEWAQALGGHVTEGFAEGKYQSTPMDIQVYLSESERLFPGAHDAYWNTYMNLDKEQRKQYAKDNASWIYDYWDWQKAMYKEFPGLEDKIWKPKADDLFSEDYAEKYNLPDISTWDGALLSQVYDANLYGDKLNNGAMTMLKYYYMMSGAQTKGIEFEEWLNMAMLSIMQQ